MPLGVFRAITGLIVIIRLGISCGFPFVGLMPGMLGGTRTRALTLRFMHLCMTLQLRIVLCIACLIVVLTLASSLLGWVRVSLRYSVECAMLDRLRVLWFIRFIFMAMVVLLR